MPTLTAIRNLASGALDLLQRRQLQSAGYERAVWVVHGPVAYPADATRLVEPVPMLFKGIAVNFIKRPEYAWQREYRFAVSTVGTPEQDQLWVPITPRLRSLADAESRFEAGLVPAEHVGGSLRAVPAAGGR